ncbi:hypothetical protein [Microcoleus sp. F4-D5]|uniref:hypothetical protein n=1 Tax=Microcoleus sp. F4-D5 TaxID=2818760 RepID=UPI002FD54F28
MPIESAAKEFIAKEVLLDMLIDLDTNQVAMDLCCILFGNTGRSISIQISQHGGGPDAIAPNFCTSAIGYNMTHQNQIKTVLEDEPDAFLSKLTAGIAVVTQ